MGVRWAKACSLFLRKFFTKEVDARSFLIKSRHGEMNPAWRGIRGVDLALPELVWGARFQGPLLRRP